MILAYLAWTWASIKSRTCQITDSDPSTHIAWSDKSIPYPPQPINVIVASEVALYTYHQDGGAFFFFMFGIGSSGWKDATGEIGSVGGHLHQVLARGLFCAVFNDHGTYLLKVNDHFEQLGPALSNAVLAIDEDRTATEIFGISRSDQRSVVSCEFEAENTDGTLTHKRNNKNGSVAWPPP